jgi:hypothetical protein
VQLSLKTREARYEYFLGPNPGAKRGRNTRGVTADLTQDDRKQEKKREKGREEEESGMGKNVISPLFSLLNYSK